MSNRGRRGILLMDAMIGLITVGALATVMAIALNRQVRADQKLSDTRAALRLAERALHSMQTSGKLPELDKESSFRVVPDRECKDVPAGRVWVEVEAIYRGRKTKLSGVVPEKSIPTEGRAP